MDKMMIDKITEALDSLDISRSIALDCKLIVNDPNAYYEIEKDFVSGRYKKKRSMHGVWAKDKYQSITRISFEFSLEEYFGDIKNDGVAQKPFEGDQNN